MNVSTELDTPRTATPPSGQLNEIERAVSCVELDTPDEQVLELRERLLSMKSRISEMLTQIDNALIERNINAEIGTRRIYVAKEKDTKCRALRPALQALLECSEGDWDAVADCLSTNAIKPGAARNVLGNKWGEHFEVIEKDKLKVQDVDTKFLKK